MIQAQCAIGWNWQTASAWNTSFDIWAVGFCGNHRNSTHSIFFGTLVLCLFLSLSPPTPQQIIFMGLILWCHLWCFANIWIRSVIVAQEIDWKWQILPQSFRIDLAKMCYYFQTTLCCQWLCVARAKKSRDVHLNPLQRGRYFKIATIFCCSACLLASSIFILLHWKSHLSSAKLSFLFVFHVICYCHNGSLSLLIRLLLSTFRGIFFLEILVRFDDMACDECAFGNRPQIGFT